MLALSIKIYFSMWLTLLLDHEFDKSLLVVALSDDVDQDVVLLEHAVDLVVLVLDDGALSVPYCRLDHILLLADILFICISKGSS